MLSRRQVLAAMGAATVLGFSTSARAWVSGPKKKKCGNSELPDLDGELVIDASQLTEYSVDAGNIVHYSPIAALLPGSVADVQKMIGYCRKHGIQVAARGQGHTTFGQSMVDGGLIIDMSSLNAIHSLGPTQADVGAGLKWNELLGQSLQQGLTPAVLTGYLGLSVGGTLSVGGISSTNGRGAQVDRVSALEVVTGKGDRVWCSDYHHRALFEAALAGLGQYGIITRAVVDLLPAPELARVYLIDHSDPASFFSDLRALLERGELDDVYNFGFPDGAGGWVYQLTATKFHDASSPPDDSHLMRDLSVPVSAIDAQSMPYINYALRVDVAIDFFRQIGMWDGVQHPWFDVFLPSWSVEPYVTDVMSTLTVEDVGPTGFLLLVPAEGTSADSP